MNISAVIEYIEATASALKDVLDSVVPEELKSVFESSMLILQLASQRTENEESVLSTAHVVAQLSKTLADKLQAEPQSQNAVNVDMLQGVLADIVAYILEVQGWSSLVKFFKAKDIADTLAKHRRLLHQAVSFLSLDLNVNVECGVKEVQAKMDAMMSEVVKMNDKFSKLLSDDMSKNRRELESQNLLVSVVNAVGLLKANDPDHIASGVTRKLESLESTMKTSLRKKCKLAQWILSTNDVTFDERDKLGEGGSGAVYEGRYLGKPVAVKKFLGHANTEDIERNILKEVKSWASVSHLDHVASFIGVCTKTTTPLLVMELCDVTISSYARDQPRAIPSLCIQLLCAIVSIHALRVIHGDIKDVNVLVDEDGSVFIIDFGLSIECHRTLTMSLSTRPGQSTDACTPMFASPEQSRGDELTFASDIWSVAMTLYNILTGETPYPRRKESQLLENLKLVEPKLPDFTKIPQEYGKMEAVLKKCLRVRQSERPSAAQLLKMTAEAFPDGLAHPCMTEHQRDLLKATRPVTTPLPPTLPPREEVAQTAPPQPESEPAVVRSTPAIPEWLQYGGVAGAHASAYSGLVAPLRRLRTSNQYFYEETDQHGKTPFYYAVLMDRYEAVVFLGQCYMQDNVFVPPRVVQEIDGLGKNYLRKYLRGEQSIEEAVMSATDVLYAPHAA